MSPDLSDTPITGNSDPRGFTGAKRGNTSTEPRITRATRFLVNHGTGSVLILGDVRDPKQMELMEAALRGIPDAGWGVGDRKAYDHVWAKIDLDKAHILASRATGSIMVLGNAKDAKSRELAAFATERLKDSGWQTLKRAQFDDVYQAVLRNLESTAEPTEATA